MSSTVVRKTFAGATALALAGCGFAVGRFTEAGPAVAHAAAAPSVAAAPPVVAAVADDGTRAGRPSFAALVERVSPAVVHIKVTSVVNAASPFGDDEAPGRPGQGFPFPFPMPRQGGGMQRGSGSGFIISKDGVIVTNNHVVARAKEITVRLADGREFGATVLGRDPKTDLAVVKVEAKEDLPAVTLGDSDRVKVGDWAVAIGNPFGLSNTVTAGIVSAKGRALGNGPYDDFIQTDAPINPGNSGGPLFDERGNVIGINAAIFSQTGGNIGIGFAIPVNLAKTLVPQLAADGHVTRGWLGVSVQKLTTELAESLGIDVAHGALVGGVTAKGPAAKAGLRAGDVITRYDGKDVADVTVLPTLVADTPAGKTVPVEVVRDGKRQTFDVTIAKLTDDDPEEPHAAGDTTGNARVGLALRELSPAERAQRGLAPDEGVLVADVVDGSPAEAAGLEPGDVILQANRTAVGSVADLRAALGAAPKGMPVLVLVRPSDGNDRFAALSPR